MRTRRNQPTPEKPDKPEKPKKPKVAGGGEIGSGWTPGVSDGSHLLPDSARQPLEDIGIDRRHVVPRRR